MTDTPPILVHRHKLKDNSGMRRHIRGESRNKITEAQAPMHDPETGDELGVELLCPSMPETELRRLLYQRKKAIKAKRGPKPKPYADMIFTAAKRTEWEPAKARAWASEVHDWITERFPDSPIVECALHLDESQVHVHALILPRGRGIAGEIIHGMTAACRTADAILQNKNVASDFDGEAKSAAASRLLDDAWDQLGRPFGLGRGEQGSQRETKELTDVERAKRAVEESLERAAQIKAQAEKEQGITYTFRKAQLQKKEADLAKRIVAETDRKLANDEKKKAIDAAEKRLAKARDDFFTDVKNWCIKAPERKARDARWAAVEDHLDGADIPLERARDAQKKDERQRWENAEIKRIARGGNVR